MNVPEHVVQKTTKCPNDLSCLTIDQSDNCPKCDVARVCGDDVLFLSSKQRSSCPYRLDFGSQQICTCPTHFALRAKRV